MITKKGVFDRIEQSFGILSKKQNFFNLVGPIFIYKLVFGILLWNFVSFVLLGDLDLQKTDVLSNPYYIIIFALIIIGFLLYITFFVGFVLSIIKTTKDIFEEKEVHIRENLKYGFNNIISSFNTYWYIFAYIFLIPFFIFVLGGILFILGKQGFNNQLLEYSYFILGFSIFVLLFFMIYRGVKTNFSLVSAVSKDNYSKLNFRESLEITKNNWWRILGNFLLLSVILSIVFSIISISYSGFKTTVFDIIDIKGLSLHYVNNDLDPNMISEIKKNVMQFYDSFYLNNFLISIVDLFFEQLKFVFTLVFSYVFYARLYHEKFGNSLKFDNNITKKSYKIEL